MSNRGHERSRMCSDCAGTRLCIINCKDHKSKALEGVNGEKNSILTLLMIVEVLKTLKLPNHDAYFA